MKLMEMVSASALAMGAVTVFPVYAQTAESSAKAPPQETASDASFSDIIVTANRREENAQTVPVSVIAFGTEALAEKSVRSLGDLTAVAPGIRFVHQGGGGNMNVVMRGLQRIPIGVAPNAVINYFADIPLNFQGSNIPAYDLGSVQVLKGPQGTLFGRNAIGGAVIITPQAPTYNLEGYVRGSYGNYDYKDVEGAINVPIIDGKIALRLSGKMTRRDGYTKNLSGGHDMDDVHQDSFRASLLIEPTDGFRNITIFDWFRAREAGTGSILSAVLPTGLVRVPQLAHFFDCHTVNAFNPGCGAIPGALPAGNDIDDTFALQQQLGPRKTFSEINQRLNRDLWGVSNKTEFALSDAVTLRNIFGYRRTHLETDLNTDGVAFTPLPIITASNRAREEQISDEFHVFGTLFNDRLDYLVGAFYIKENPTGLEGSNFPVAAAAGPWVIAYTDKTNKAVFGQLGFKITDSIKLNGGIRYNKTSQSACSVTEKNTVPTILIDTSEPSIAPDACASAAGASTASTKESATTYNVGVDWQVSDSIFAYVTHRKGYREGGLNYPGFTTPCTTGNSNGVCIGNNGLPTANPADLRPYQSYQPETLKDVEIGVKSEFRLGEGRLRFNVSAYRGTYSNAVVAFNTSAIVPSNDTSAPQSSSIGINVGKRRLSGFETEVMFQPNRSLSFTNTLAYVHQKILSNTLPDIPGLQLPSLTPASPKWSLTNSIRWVLPFRPADGEIVLNADHYHQSRFYNGNDTFAAYDNVNARIEWSGIGGSGMTVAAFLRNAFNDTYAYASSASSASLGIFTRSYNEPRMYGLELGYKF
ncbi:TonB-dependent receptor [Sphingomonas bisphenolicum]|uniref:TonB-dependent receptor n=1 Tax=Sphingomonas bisphenolicum TaxID=296544 RepID=A0ABM7GA03_9SPHN|nr:TonB-dependent receptor [Sphingomonas bisphenolicum]BBF72251.1 TonB-dependent receptor [Sphingomonas bisphenolicum]